MHRLLLGILISQNMPLSEISTNVLPDQRFKSSPSALGRSLGSSFVSEVPPSECTIHDSTHSECHSMRAVPVAPSNPTTGNRTHSHTMAIDCGQCTACGERALAEEGSDPRTHPKLDTLLCFRCYDRVNREFEVDVRALLAAERLLDMPWHCHWISLFSNHFF